MGRVDYLDLHSYSGSYSVEGRVMMLKILYALREIYGTRPLKEYDEKIIVIALAEGLITQEEFKQIKSIIE